jgi:tetratricopeptide (TPR) repeat protein
MNASSKGLLALAILSVIFPTVSTGADVPFLISRQSEAVEEAWRTVEELVRENATLKQPLPDPLFARADLWASVGNHEDALDDYLQGTKLLFAMGPSLVEQSRALSRLAGALERLSKQPRPEYPYEAEDSFWLGVRHFEDSRYELAEPFFAEATRLMPSDAVFRAYRGLTLKRLGRLAHAERQLAVAASILRRPECLEQERQGFHIRLQNIQGSSRQWIQEKADAPLSSSQSLAQETAHWLRQQRSAIR